MSVSEIKQLLKEVTELRKEITELTKNNVDIKVSCKDIKNKLHGLVEIQTRLVHNQLDAPIPTVAKVSESKASGKNSNFKIEISMVDGDDGRIKVTGKNTFDHRGVIKNAGYATFDKENKYWTLEKSSLENLVTGLKEAGLTYNSCFIVSIPGYNVTNGSGMSGATGSKGGSGDNEEEDRNGGDGGSGGGGFGVF